MIQKKVISILIIIILVSCSQQVKNSEHPMNAETNWKTEVEQTLKLFGHRNWIVIADSAYPEQSNPAIKTITIDESQIDAVNYVNRLIEKAPHVDANIFIDKELDFVSEEHANGVEKYRTDLIQVLEGKSVKTMLHENIIKELDASAKLFNILILKTDLAIPYTSVFFQLECGYWNAEAENNLRQHFESTEQQ